MQRHEREALAVITEAAQALALEVRVLPAGRNPHMQVDLVDPASGKKERIGISCSPKNRDHLIKAVRRDATRACRKLLGEK